MIRTFLVAAIAAVAVTPSAQAASECSTPAMAGSWLVDTGDEVCQVSMGSAGRFRAECQSRDGDPPTTTRGQVRLNASCVLRMFVDGEQRFEGRAWATSSPMRMDAFQGFFLNFDEELIPISGYRRPNAGVMPLP